MHAVCKRLNQRDQLSPANYQDHLFQKDLFRILVVHWIKAVEPVF